MPGPAPVTVVIPAYKAEATVRRAIDSVLAQQGVEPRVVVVIDGLLDRTRERLDGYDPEAVRVLVNEHNCGAQISRNRGLAETDTEYVMFLDCDDFVEGPLIAGLVSALRDRDADLAIGPMQVMKEDASRLPTVHLRFDSPENLYWNWLGFGRTVNPSAILWRTSFLRKVGGWNEQVRRNQDGEVILRAVMAGAEFVHSTAGRGIYVHHDSQDRITKRLDVLESRLDVGEQLLGRSSGVISEEVKRGAIARYFYRVAMNCYSRGVSPLGDRALQRARELGFRGHFGPLWHQALAWPLGVKLRYRLTNLVKRLRPFGFEGL